MDFIICLFIKLVLQSIDVAMKLVMFWYCLGCLNIAVYELHGGNSLFVHKMTMNQAVSSLIVTNEFPTTQVLILSVLDH